MSASVLSAAELARLRRLVTPSDRVDGATVIALLATLDAERRPAAGAQDVDAIEAARVKSSVLAAGKTHLQVRGLGSGIVRMSFSRMVGGGECRVDHWDLSAEMVAGLVAALMQADGTAIGKPDPGPAEDVSKGVVANTEEGG